MQQPCRQNRLVSRRPVLDQNSTQFAIGLRHKADKQTLRFLAESRRWILANRQQSEPPVSGGLSDFDPLIRRCASRLGSATHTQSDHENGGQENNSETSAGTGIRRNALSVAIMECSSGPEKLLSALERWRGLPLSVARCALPSYHSRRLQKFAKFFKKFLHLWKFPVISQLRTNFAEMPGKTHEPGSREMQCLVS